MVNSIRAGAHGCAIVSKVNDAGYQVDDEYGRVFPGLALCEVDEAAKVDLLAFATEPSP